MAFQNPTLMPWRTTLDNVLLPMEVVEPHKRRFRSHRAEYDRAGDQAPEDGRPRRLRATLSLAAFGGMQQRSNLCRALIHEPETPDARRAVRRARRLHARGAVGRHAGAVAGEALHRRAGDARPARGGLSRRHRLCHEQTARPHRLTSKIDIPRPRTLATTFEPHFVDIVHELRDRISQEHA
jgi:NitT/TauT family transport system ATP-binding protein